MNPSDLNNNLGRFLEAPNTLDIDALTDSVFLSFKLLEPWYGVGKRGVKHPLIAATVQKIVRQANEYSAAVTQSLETVNDGWTFASDVIALTDYMSSGQSSIEDLKSFLASMVEFSSAAHRRALATNERFRKVRRELLQISSDIPSILAKIDAQKRREGDCSNSSDTISLPSPISHDMFPGVNERSKGKTNTKIWLGRIMKKHSLTDIMAQLQQTHRDINQLISHVGHSAQFWGSIRLGMIALRTSLPHALLHGMNPLQESTTLIRQQWMQVQQNYMTYTHRIHLLEDYFPMLVQQRKLLKNYPNENSTYTFPRASTSRGPVVPSSGTGERSTSRSSSDTVVAHSRINNMPPPISNVKLYSEVSDASDGRAPCCVIC